MRRRGVTVTTPTLPSVSGRAALAAGLLFTLLGGAGPAAGQQDREQAGRLTGYVWDRERGSPLPAVRLVLAPAGPAGRTWLAESDSLGNFAFSAFPPGHYTLTVEALGYHQLSDTLTLLPGQDPVVEVAMVPEALELEPVLVRVAARRSRALRGFDERRTMGSGTFVTRDEIEEQRPHQVTDLFRSMAGVRLVNDRQGAAHVTLRGRCRPDLVMDGAPVDNRMSLDLLLRPDDVEAIEVHSSASAPIAYTRGGCGVVMIWTRIPQRQADGGPWWRGLMVGGLIVSIIALIR